jgi:hypothetical protein
MLTDPKFVLLSEEARLAFLRISECGPPGLIPCFFKFRQMLHTHDGEILEHRKQGIELGWREPEAVPQSLRGMIESRECGYSLGTVIGESILLVHHDGRNFFLASAS